MSKENLQKFISFVAENKELATKIQELGGDVEVVAKYARELGYDFDGQELAEYRKKMTALLHSRVEKKLAAAETPKQRPGVGQLKELLNLAETDETVAKRLAEIVASDSEALIAYGREKGFDFNKDDMEAFAKEVVEPSDELSDEELELAAGGTLLGVAVASVVIYIALGSVVGAVTAVGVAAAVVGVGLLVK